MFFRSCGRKTRLGYHRRPARADTAKTLNFVAKAPTALAHANFTMLRRRASPACPDHPLLPVANPLLPWPTLLLEIRQRSKLRRWLFHVSAEGARTLSCDPGMRRKSHLDVRPDDVRCT